MNIDNILPEFGAQAMAGIHVRASSSLLAWIKRWDALHASPEAGPASPPSAGRGTNPPGAARAVRLWRVSQSGATGYSLAGSEREKKQEPGKAGGIAEAFRKRERTPLPRMRPAAAKPLPAQDELVRQARQDILEGLSRLLD